MCIFCKIANKEIKAEILYESDDVLAFKDAHPLAPIHILIIPKKHIEGIDFLGEAEEDILLAGKMIIAAKKLADKAGIGKKGYKLLFRVGRDGGQEVGHIHLHLLGGAKLSEDIKPI
ncbi:MAG: histidine triad nucleotide-binding protein [Patescibacteria group bacterium]|nr:histidine triad nucleotide-binding protein [Patescibacteria group bacterium]MBU4141855.1 histidine triad nucleotide-binding protein [Patescibacteria group bacterium]